TTQPLGVFQVVSSTLVPGTYTTEVGWLIPNGAKRKKPASRSSKLPKTLGESKRGTQSQSIAPSGATSAPVWQSDRNAYDAMGGNGDGAAALCGRFSVVGATAVTTSPTAHATGNGRRPASRLRLAPMNRGRRQGPAAARLRAAP